MNASCELSGSLYVTRPSFSASSVSWPCGRLRVDDAGVVADVRPHLLRYFLALGAGGGAIRRTPTSGRALWAASWSEVEHVRVSPTAFAVVLGSGHGAMLVRPWGCNALLERVPSGIEVKHEQSGNRTWFGFTYGTRG